MLLTYSDLTNDYKNSGFDRGHNSPSADNLCEGQIVQKECFYFTNMTPQYHILNAGDWKMLEELTRTLAKDKDSIKVWCGSIGSQKKIGRVSVPTKCWKVIYIKAIVQTEADFCCQKCMYTIIRF
jgi:endonuclease G